MRHVIFGPGEVLPPAPLWAYKRRAMLELDRLLAKGTEDFIMPVARIPHALRSTTVEESCPQSPRNHGRTSEA